MSKFALVTGASGGIGFECARILASQGYGLVVVARNLDKLNALKANFENIFRVPVEVMPADLSVPNIVDEIVAELEKKKIDIEILINNAGFGMCGSYTEMDWDREAEMLQVNITALTQLTKKLLPKMILRGSGRIMNVASTAAFQPGPLMAVYYATKSYVLSYSQALSYELKETGVTVTCLCPGPTSSGFQKVADMESVRFLGMVRMPSSQVVAEYGCREMFKGRRLAVQGFTNRSIVFMQRFLPRSWVLRATAFIQEKK